MGQGLTVALSKSIGQMSDFYNLVDIDAQRKPTQTKLFGAILSEENICSNRAKSDKFVIIEKFY